MTMQGESSLDGAKSPNLSGSVIAIQVWLQLSPFKVVFDFAQDDNVQKKKAGRTPSSIPLFLLTLN